MSQFQEIQHSYRNLIPISGYGYENSSHFCKFQKHIEFKAPIRLPHNLWFMGPQTLMFSPIESWEWGLSIGKRIGVLRANQDDVSISQNYENSSKIKKFHAYPYPYPCVQPYRIGVFGESAPWASLVKISAEYNITNDIIVHELYKTKYRLPLSVSPP